MLFFHLYYLQRRSQRVKYQSRRRVLEWPSTNLSWFGPHYRRMGRIRPYLSSRLGLVAVYVIVEVKSFDLRSLKEGMARTPENLHVYEALEKN